MPQGEIRQNKGYSTLSEALDNYLDPQQAKPETFRMGLANAVHTIGQFFGVDKTLPEIEAELEANRADQSRLNADRMRRAGMKIRSNEKPIPDDSLPIFEKREISRILPVIAGIKGANLESKVGELTEPVRKAYLNETRYQRGLMGDIGEKPKYKYDSPEQVYGTTSVSEEPIFEAGTRSPKDLEAYKKLMKAREYGKLSVAEDVAQEHPELRDMLRSGGSKDVLLVTGRGTKGTVPELNNFGALEDVPFNRATDEALFRDPETIKEAEDIIEMFRMGRPEGDLSLGDVDAAYKFLEDASEVAQHKRMMQQNKDYLSYPIAKDYLKGK